MAAFLFLKGAVASNGPADPPYAKTHRSRLVAEHLFQAIQMRARAGHGLEGAVKQDIVQSGDAAIEAFAAGQKITQCPRQ